MKIIFKIILKIILLFLLLNITIVLSVNCPPKQIMGPCECPKVRTKNVDKVIINVFLIQLKASYTSTIKCELNSTKISPETLN